MRVFTFQRNVLTGLLVALVGLLLVEALARVIRTIEIDVDGQTLTLEEKWFVYSPTLGWEKKPGYRGLADDHVRHFDRLGYFAVDSTQISDTTKEKIIFIGDSNTFGFGVPTESSFVEVVEKHLTSVSTINLGVIGYTSYQGRVLLEKYLPLLKPEMVVVSFNFNDRRYVLRGDEIDSAERFEKVYRSSLSPGFRVPEFLETSYAFRALRRVMRKVGLVPVTEVKEVRVDALKPRVDEDAYRRNLSRIAEETRRRGIPVVFVLLKDNPIESHHLKQGIANLTKSVETAVAHLTVAIESQAFSDLARLFLRQAYQMQGRTDEAARIVTSRRPFVSLHGGHVIRLDTAYNDIMRQVAAEHGVELVDAAKALDEYPHVYIDACHFDANGHRIVGELLATRISTILLGGHKSAPQ